MCQLITVLIFFIFCNTYIEKGLYINHIIRFGWGGTKGIVVDVITCLLDDE